MCFTLDKIYHQISFEELEAFGIIVSLEGGLAYGPSILIPINEPTPVVYTRRVAEVVRKKHKAYNEAVEAAQDEQIKQKVAQALAEANRPGGTLNKAHEKLIAGATNAADFQQVNKPV